MWTLEDRADFSMCSVSLSQSDRHRRGSAFALKVTVQFLTHDGESHGAIFRYPSSVMGHASSLQFPTFLT